MAAIDADSTEPVVAPIAPNATPIAKPSGILCNVIEKTNKIDLFILVVIPSFTLPLPKCICGIILSAPYKNKPPNENPIAATSQAILPCSSAISIPGAKSDQKLAATITPAATPYIIPSTFLLIFLKKNTKPAPSAVTNHVNKPPKSACNHKSKLINHSNIFYTSIYKFILFYKHYSTK